MRWNYGLPAKYVLYVGSNKPHKNVTRLIQAWPHVREWTRTPLILVIAGYLDARYPEMYEAIAQLGLGDVVRLLPNVAEQDLAALYSGAQVFVFASSYEGFGLPVLEAMACGCAVACADSSALREVAGDAAIFFDPQQPADIARAVVTLLQQPRHEEFQQKVLERSAQFSWDFVAQQTVRTYRQAAKLYPVCTPRL